MLIVFLIFATLLHANCSVIEIDNNQIDYSPGIYILPIPTDNYEIPENWSIPMPKISYYAGFDRPNNETKWKECLLRASRGEQVLLQKVLQIIKSPFQFIHGDRYFKWIHKLADEYKSKKTGYLDIETFKKNRHRLPISMLGYRNFDRPNFEGKHVHPGEDLSVHDIFREKNFTIPTKIVAIGNMDENWGWLSSYYLNRTVPWSFTFQSDPNPFHSDYKSCSIEMNELLSNPNLIVLFVNQHHNCSHPKVLSVPLGMNDPKEMWDSLHKAERIGLKKNELMFSAGSNWAFRPMIRNCVKVNMNDNLIVKEKISPQQFRIKLISAMTVLCMPGLGWDTYRLWETLAAG